MQVLRNAKNLRLAKEGGWQTVFIHQDMTPKQQEARKQLVQELKERAASGEGDLIIFNGKSSRKDQDQGAVKVFLHKCKQSGAD